MELKDIVAVPDLHYVHGMARAIGAFQGILRVPTFNRPEGDNRLDLRYSYGGDFDVHQRVRLRAVTLFKPGSPKTKPLPFEVLLKVDSEWMPLNFIHEIGHVLDWYAFEPFDEISCETSSIFADWRAAVVETHAYKNMMRLYSYDEVSFRNLHTGELSNKYPIDKSEMAEALSFYEWWGRCLCEFIAKRRPGSAIAKLLQALQSTTMNAIYGYQFTDDDFEEVDRQMVLLFERQGWYKA